jgi:hypothetical protein
MKFHILPTTPPELSASAWRVSKLELPFLVGRNISQLQHYRTLVQYHHDMIVFNRVFTFVLRGGRAGTSECI